MESCCTTARAEERRRGGEISSDTRAVRGRAGRATVAAAALRRRPRRRRRRRPPPRPGGRGGRATTATAARATAAAAARAITDLHDDDGFCRVASRRVADSEIAEPPAAAAWPITPLPRALRLPPPDRRSRPWRHRPPPPCSSPRWPSRVREPTFGGPASLPDCQERAPTFVRIDEQFAVSAGARPPPRRIIARERRAAPPCRSASDRSVTARRAAPALRLVTPARWQYTLCSGRHGPPAAGSAASRTRVGGAPSGAGPAGRLTGRLLEAAGTHTRHAMPSWPPDLRQRAEVPRGGYRAAAPQRRQLVRRRRAAGRRREERRDAPVSGGGLADEHRGRARAGGLGAPAARRGSSRGRRAPTATSAPPALAASGARPSTSRSTSRNPSSSAARGQHLVDRRRARPPPPRRRAPPPRRPPRPPPPRSRRAPAAAAPCKPRSAPRAAGTRRARASSATCNRGRPCRAAPPHAAAGRRRRASPPPPVPAARGERARPRDAVRRERTRGPRRERRSARRARRRARAPRAARRARARAPRRRSARAWCVAARKAGAGGEQSAPRATRAGLVSRAAAAATTAATRSAVRAHSGLRLLAAQQPVEQYEAHGGSRDRRGLVAQPQRATLERVVRCRLGGCCCSRSRRPRKLCFAAALAFKGGASRFAAFSAIRPLFLTTTIVRLTTLPQLVAQLIWSFLGPPKLPISRPGHRPRLLASVSNWPGRGWRKSSGLEGVEARPAGVSAPHRRRAAVAVAGLLGGGVVVAVRPLGEPPRTATACRRGPARRAALLSSACGASASESVFFVDARRRHSTTTPRGRRPLLGRRVRRSRRGGGATAAPAWVAQGVRAEAERGVANPRGSFRLVEGVRVYGGFRGDELGLGARAPPRTRPC